MRGPGIALLLAFAATAAAQTSSMPATAMAMPQGNCPIGVDVHQQAHGAYLLTDTARSFHPSFVISFRPHGDHTIQQVVLDVVGPSGLRLRDAAALTQATSNADVVETFTLTGSGDATIVTKKLTAVEWFSLVSVTYADGSSWHRGGTDACYVPPNGFVPVH
ncbi:hypothetical protein [Terriglobus roseus]|uniref:Uncharacterized protein n=1 Tax=Terriglobus roseus TaxID=392734 RepID=A0A1G7M492_9BACT|nr:hypothetical protein [Terriglobus roseus]SDF56020.1 hypothetical protein SAMN05444167_2683 [Terriglobus roseus]